METLTVANSKLKQDDRILILKTKEGSTAKSSTGVIDNRLFTGENKLHAIMNPTTCLWRMKYESGVLPVPLQGEFTNFTKLKKVAENYFKSRNIEIVEVQE